MYARFRAVGSALCLVAALACQPSSTPDVAASAGDEKSESSSPDFASGPVVAEVGGVAITEGELDQWIMEELFAQQAGSGPAKLYELRAAALERMIGVRVLEQAAVSQGIAKEAVLEKAAESLGPVSDEEIAAFYEDNKAQMRGATLEQIGPQIREFLEQRRQVDAVAAVREEASVVVHLAPPRFEIAAMGPERGPKDARVTIVEFSDFECPYCKRADQIVKQVLEKYPDDVRLVYRHLPLDNIHQRARPAAEASACAADQDKFWDFHDKLFENQRALSDDDFKRVADEIGLDRAKFDECLAQRKHQQTVETDAVAAREAGVTGTPAFFVNGRLLSGARPAEAFYEIIEAELANDTASTGSSG